MSEGKRSFFATIPGLVTGLAGLLTGIVGLVTVLIQLGVVGDDSSDKPDTTGPTGTTVAGAPAPGGAGAGNTATTEVPRFAVSPTSLDFTSGSRTKPVKVTNESRSGSVTVDTPRVLGTDRAQFSVSSGDCNVPLAAGRSCELQVTFAPSGPLRSYSASLEVSVRGANAQEVRLSASSVLG